MLAAGRSATLRFAIGPPWSTSLTPGAVPSLPILSSKEDLPLTVLFSCDFCEPDAEPSKRTVYRPREGRSDEVQLRFTPRRPADGRAYTGRLQLGIYNDAIAAIHDRLQIEVAVAGTGAVPAAAPPAAVRQIAHAPPEATGPPRADVVLHVGEQMGSTVSISVQPISDEMKRRLPLAFDADGKRRVFRSGIDDRKLIEAMTSTAYGDITSLSLQGEFLQRLRAAGTDAAVSRGAQTSLQFSDEESVNVTKVLAEVGKLLYLQLFAASRDTDLKKLIVQLEAAAAEPRQRPLRLRIFTTNLSLPWQYLHPVGPTVDAEKFWGLRFSLSTLRNNDGATGGETPPPAAASASSRKVVFARYGRSKDPTVVLAEEQQQMLRRLPVAERDLIVVDSGDDLMANLERRREEITAVVTFLHAKAASADAEPQLSFNEGDVVTSSRLVRLKAQVAMEDQDRRYLAAQPLVILNACETGPSVNLAHVSLENALSQLGATGVVVTEVPVWVPLGHEVATALITRLGRGETIADALTAVRRDLYRTKKNPLGLLYLYYGDPAATLRP